MNYVAFYITNSCNPPRVNTQVLSVLPLYITYDAHLNRTEIYKDMLII